MDPRLAEARRYRAQARQYEEVAALLSLRYQRDELRAKAARCLAIAEGLEAEVERETNAQRCSGDAPEQP